MSLRIETGADDERARALAAAATALRRGQLVGLPLDSTYGIAADAFHEGAIASLRSAKGRAGLVIPVMVPRIATVSGVALVDDNARALMRGFWPGPLTLVLRAQPTLAWSLSDDSGRIAVRMPLHPVALDLLDRTGPLGVVAGVPGARTPDEAFANGLAEHLAVLLDAGALPPAATSAVVDLSGEAPVLVRAGPIDPADLLAECPGLVVPSPEVTGSAP